MKMDNLSVFMMGHNWTESVFISKLYIPSTKAVTSVRCPKMKRDASVKVVFLLRKKTTFTEASLFIFGLRTDVTALPVYKIKGNKTSNKFLLNPNQSSI